MYLYKIEIYLQAFIMQTVTIIILQKNNKINHKQNKDRNQNYSKKNSNQNRSKKNYRNLKNCKK